jgi:hypothetical protein
MHRRVGSGDGRSRYWFPLTAIPPPSRPPLLGGGKLPPPAGAGRGGSVSPYLTPQPPLLSLGRRGAGE